MAVQTSEVDDMARAAVEQLVHLLDEAFDGAEQPQQSMLGNLRSVTEADWLWVPPGGARTVRRITGHVGGAAYLYYDRAFGNCEAFGEPITSWKIVAGDLPHGTADLDDSPHLDPEPPMADVVAWVTERARIFRDAVAALDDDRLRDERSNHHRQPKPISWSLK